MNVIKLLPDFSTLQNNRIDVNKVKDYLSRVLQIVFGLNTNQSNVRAIAIDNNNVSYEYYLPMINNSLNGVLSNEGVISIDMLHDQNIVLTIKSGTPSYLVQDGKLVVARESGDVFVKDHRGDIYLITSYGKTIYSPALGKEVSAVVDGNGRPYNSLDDAFVIVKMNNNQEPEFYEGRNGIMYFDRTFRETMLPMYFESQKSWLFDRFNNKT